METEFLSIVHIHKFDFFSFSNVLPSMNAGEEENVNSTVCKYGHFEGDSKFGVSGRIDLELCEYGFKD